jgi:hypothetical protein
MWNPPSQPFVYLESSNHPAGLLPDSQDKIIDKRRLDKRAFENVKLLIQESKSYGQLSRTVGC